MKASILNRTKRAINCIIYAI
ncbi:hypothetical protein AZZ63_000969, partial [Enterobacter hormaechei]